MIQMIGQFQTKAEGRATFRTAMLDVVKGTANEPGALAVRLFEDVNNPDLMFGYERLGLPNLRRSSSFSVGGKDWARGALVVSILVAMTMVSDLN